MKSYTSKVLKKNVTPQHFNTQHHAKVLESALQAEREGKGQRADVFETSFTYAR